MITDISVKSKKKGISKNIGGRRWKRFYIICLSWSYRRLLIGTFNRNADELKIELSEKVGFLQHRCKVLKTREAVWYKLVKVACKAQKKMGVSVRVLSINTKHDVHGKWLGSPGKRHCTTKIISYQGKRVTYCTKNVSLLYLKSENTQSSPPECTDNIHKPSKSCWCLSQIPKETE